MFSLSFLVRLTGTPRLLSLIQCSLTNKSQKTLVISSTDRPRLFLFFLWCCPRDSPSCHVPSASWPTCAVTWPAVLAWVFVCSAIYRPPPVPTGWTAHGDEQREPGSAGREQLVPDQTSVAKGETDASLAVAFGDRRTVRKKMICHLSDC